MCITHANLDAPWSGAASGARPRHVRVRVVSRFSALQKTGKNIEMAANASVFRFRLPYRSGAAVRLLPGSCPVPARFLPLQEPGRNRAGTGQEPGRSRAGAGQQPHGRTTPIRNLKTLTFVAISIFLPVFCSAEKRLTTRARTSAAGRQKRRQTTAPDKSHHFCAGASYHFLNAPF